MVITQAWEKARVDNNVPGYARIRQPVSISVTWRLCGCNCFLFLFLFVCLFLFSVFNFGFQHLLF